MPVLLLMVVLDDVLSAPVATTSLAVAAANPVVAPAVGDGHVLVLAAASAHRQRQRLARYYIGLPVVVVLVLVGGVLVLVLDKGPDF